MSAADVELGDGTYALFLRLFHLTPTPSYLRRGQFFFNFLHAVKPALANSMRGRGVDPFYDDRKLDLALTYVAVHWDKFN